MLKLLKYLIIFLIPFPSWASPNPQSCLVSQWPEVEWDAAARSLLNELDATPDNYPSTLESDAQFVLCRELGLLQPNLRRHWPSAENSSVFHHIGDMSEQTIEVFEKHASDAIVELERGYDTVLAYPVDIILGYSLDDLVAVYEQVYPKDPHAGEIADELNLVCENSFGAITTYNNLILCPLDANENYDPTYNPLEEITSDMPYIAAEIFFHEMFHVAMNESAGIGWHCDSKTQNCVENEPLWFGEGAAEFFLIKESYRVYYSKIVRNINWSDTLPSNLSSLSRVNLTELSDDAYTLGLAAIYFLMLDHEKSKLVELYSNLGTTSSWPEAFELTFGESIESFYARFGELDSLKQ